MPRTVYADFNATAPLTAAAIARMQLAFDVWGNPSSGHQTGREAHEFLEESRRIVAEAVGVKPTEVVFTSGGSEANTLALMGSWLDDKNAKLLTSGVEHSSVKDTVACLQARGVSVEKVPVTREGTLDIDAFKAQLESFQPTLVSLMTANNETGVLFPIPEIAEICRAANVTLHTDAVQAFGKIPSSFFNGADFISISAHKLGGPKGAGALILKSGKQLVPTHFGGAQEIKRRGGTENTVGIAGFAGAVSEISAYRSELRDSFEATLLELGDTSVVGKTAARLPNTSNIRLHGINAEVLLSALDLDGICVSAGSACSSGSVKPSHVLIEMGMSAQEARECLRFSWGKTTTAEEISLVANAVASHVKRIRNRRSKAC